MQFFEISAKESLNINDIFDFIIKEFFKNDINSSQPNEINILSNGNQVPVIDNVWKCLIY